MDNLKLGYEEPENDPQLDMRAIRKLKQWAKLYSPSPEMESLVKLKETDDAAFRALGPAMTMRVGYYLQGKLAFEALTKGDLL